jgi:hypothetical protein
MDVNKTLTKVETGFNVAGSIPIVALFSSSLRYTAGIIQACVGAAIAGVSMLAQMVSKQTAKWDQFSQKGIEHLTHGVLNAVRGIVEGVAAATLLGTLIIFGVQAARPEKFAPIVKYGIPTVALRAAVSA